MNRIAAGSRRLVMGAALFAFPLALATSSTIAHGQTVVHAASGVIQAPALLGAAPPISPMDRVYTADQTSNTVTVIDPSANGGAGQVLGTFPLGNTRLDGLLTPIYYQEINVHGLGFAPDGSMLDAINTTTDSATVINAATNTVRSTAHIGRAPHEGFISPDGATLWTAVRGQDYIAVTDVTTGQELARIKTVLGVSKIVFSPDGTLAFANSSRAPELDVISVASRQVIKRITGLVSPFSPDLAISPDGQEVWLTHKDIGKVTVVDAQNFVVLTVLDTGPGTNHVNFVSKADGDYAYVTVGGTNETLVFQRNGATPTLVTRIPNSGYTPHGIWPSPDNTRVYVGLEKSDAVDVIDTDSNTVIATLNIGQDPQALVYVAGAVPNGDGRANLTQQGLNKQIVTGPAVVLSGGGSALATVRELVGLDMIQLQANGLTPNTVFTVYAANSGTGLSVPLLDFTTDGAGNGAPMAFTKFFGSFDGIIVAPQGQRPSVGTTPALSRFAPARSHGTLPTPTAPTSRTTTQTTTRTKAASKGR